VGVTKADVAAAMGGLRFVDAPAVITNTMLSKWICKKCKPGWNGNDDDHWTKGYVVCPALGCPYCAEHVVDDSPQERKERRAMTDIAEGTVWYNSDDDRLYVRCDDEWVVAAATPDAGDGLC